MRAFRTVGLVLLLALAVHVDWHIGRPVHHRLSLGWSYHWILGVASFALVTWLVLGKARDGPGQLALIVIVGLVAGQIGEPIGEVLVYREPWQSVMPAERWHVFLAFAAAGIVTSVVLAVLHRMWAGSRS
jgi:hypothetical protein